jgi:NTE family protein
MSERETSPITSAFSASSGGRAFASSYRAEGPRALAHIGAVQALEEADVPIDAVAGTSMGALIGALVVKNVKAMDIRERMRRYLIEGNPIREYTLPFVSLVRGRKLTRMFQEACEDATVEDLWKTFFCVSADLATGAAVVHQSGPLWRALRASSAIPGVFPPVMSDGQMLVDGCIVDNMPTAKMRSLNRGQVIGVDVSSASTLPPCEIAVEQKSWAWLLLGGRSKTPSMAQILMSSGAIGCGSQRASARAAADLLVEPEVTGVGMLSFCALDQTIEAGYRAMQDALPKVARAGTRSCRLKAGQNPRRRTGSCTSSLTRTTFQDVGVSKQYHPHYERAARAAAIRSQ